MRHARNILWLIALFVMATIVVSCQDDNTKTVKHDTNPERVPTMASHDIQTIISDSGHARFRITTKLWNVFSESKTPHWTFPNGLVADSLDRNYKQTSSLICDSAYYNMNRRIWSAVGHVRITRKNGDRLTTNRMYFDENTRIVQCVGNVVLKRASGDKVTCRGLFYDMNKDQTHLKDSVVLTSTKGYRILTNQAYYEKGIFYSDGFGRYEGPDRIFEGTGYEYHEADQSFVVRRVQGIIPFNDNRFRHTPAGK